MMIQIYSVYDKAVGAFLPPFYSRSKGEAVRSFMAAVSGEGNRHEFAKSPGDFTLFYVGLFNDEAGVFSSDLGPERVISALECIKPGEG